MDGETDILREVRALGALGGGEPRRGEYTGTKALMMAVLEDGIRDYRTAIGRPRIEAEGWVRSEHRGVFSFIVICETLGLEPAAVRRALGQPEHPLRPEPRRTDPRQMDDPSRKRD